MYVYMFVFSIQSLSCAVGLVTFEKKISSEILFFTIFLRMGS